MSVAVATDGVFDGRVRRRHLQLRPALVGAVFVGGCAGGAARFGVTETWPVAASGFPWPTLAVNLAGAFVLALLLVFADTVLPPTAFVRPLLGTGFCGAWTTFSAIVVDADRLVAHDRIVLGAGYVVASIGGGLVAALLGSMLGRFTVSGRANRPSRGG